MIRQHPAGLRFDLRARAQDAPDRFVVSVMSILLVVSVIFQMFVIPVGSSIVFFDVFPLYAAVAVLLFAGRLIVSPLRLILFILTFGTAVILQVGVVPDASLGSMFLAILVYAPYCGVVQATRATHRRILWHFQYVVLGICFLIYLDIAVQLAHIDMPDINRVFPAAILVQTFNYIQPLLYGWAMKKPNAFFMLEASFASQFVALGLVIEFAFFHRRLMIVAMVIGLLATFAATGILLVLASLPFLVRRYWRQALILAIVGLPLVAAGAYESGWIDIMLARADTVNRDNSSFGGRFVLPYRAMGELATTGTPTQIIAGLGAGATTRVLDLAEYTSMSRAFLEYGFIFCILFMTFTTYCFFGSGVPFIVAWITFICYNFLSGNFHIAPVINYGFVLAAGYAIHPQPTARPAAGRNIQNFLFDSGNHTV